MKVIRKIIALLLILSIGSMLTGCGMHYGFNLNFHNSTNVLKKEEAIEFTVEKAAVDPITSIDIDTRNAAIELIEAEDYFVEINYLYWEDEPSYSIEDGKLSFDDSDALPDNYSINFPLHNIIKIYMPKAALLNSLDIESSSGDVSLAGFTTEDMDVSLSYGDFTMEKASAKEADITLSSGRSTIADFQTDDLDFTNSYGNATFKHINTSETKSTAPSTDKLSITLSSGDVKLDGLNTGSLDLRNSYGDITCEEVTSDDFDVELSSGDLDISDSTFEDIDINDSYGDVTLALLGAPEDYSLDLSTSYGNIRVAGKNYDDSHVILNNDGSKDVHSNLSSGNIKVSFK